ncbi:hypothetical protein ACFVMC_27635 [Nocardia sp. NPDC127579]|uniref:hypothetical protein n=1 Tax=Nocardia sp. NPDC127579 TaxID=3345402 RepID=UPI00362F440E
MSQDEVAKWERFAAAVRSGELFLDSEDVAKQCLAACDKRVTELQDMTALVRQAQTVSGFGNFPMADQLVGQFKTQATGLDNSIDKVIQAHIDVVKDMGEIMALSVKRITGQDITNTVHFNTKVGG